MEFHHILLNICRASITHVTDPFLVCEWVVYEQRGNQDSPPFLVCEWVVYEQRGNQDSPPHMSLLLNDYKSW